MSCLSFASERARLGGVICSEKWRVNRFDYHAGTLSNYGSAFRVQVTAYLTDYWLRVATFYELTGILISVIVRSLRSITQPISPNS